MSDIYPPEVHGALVVLRRARSDSADQIEQLVSFLNETEFDIEENDIDAMLRDR